MKKIFSLIFFISTFCVFSQKEDIEKINQWIYLLNNDIDSLNTTQQKLQIYHQDLFRFYRVFDTVNINEYKLCQSSYHPFDSTITSFPLDKIKRIHTLSETFYEKKRIFDSISCSIHFENDLLYSKEKIDSIADRTQLFQALNKELQGLIFSIKNEIKIIKDEIVEKNNSEHMQSELDRIRLLITSLREKNNGIKNYKYIAPNQKEKKISKTYYEAILEFQNRLALAQNSEDSLALYHYFIPNKYFDTWLYEKYNKTQWELLFLENELNKPNVGLISTYNESIQKNKTFFEIKELQSMEFLNFEYIPLKTSPFFQKPDIFLILILDISNSMNINNKLALLKQSVNQLVDGLRSGKDKLSIILFSNVSKELVLPNNSDKEHIKYLVNQINAFGETFPESAIIRSYNIMNLQKLDSDNSRVVLITDGDFEVSSKMKYHIKQGTKKEISFSIIKLIGNDNSNPEELIRLSKVGNGLFYSIDDQQTYQTLVNEILRE